MTSRIEVNTLSVPSVADGTYTSDRISYETLLNGTAFIRFFNAEGVQVTPSSGTALFEVSEDGFNWADITNGSVDASVTDYPRPGYTQGFVHFFRVTLTSVAGASSFEATLVKNNV